ncbi:DUF3047 domain-containing protein [Candidatus Methylomirabilis sp.]|uniref:DUF3047 domain-containing protein n=1 Tax=Candidatus Methylomirabilis sp. TaxID=2032687 RepID=UPI00307654C1
MNDTATIEHEEFQSRFERILPGLPEGIVQDYAFFKVSSDKAPWFDTGIDLRTGDQVTSFAVGGTELKGTPIRFGPYFQLWFRVGVDGEIFRGTRDTHSFKAERSGRLYFASYFPGEWSTKTGDLGTPTDVYELAEGGLSVLLIRWRTDPLKGLKSLAALGAVGDLITTEIDRLTSPVILPKGWSYLWFVGPAEIYRACQAPQREHAICCHTRSDVGLLQKPVSLPLKPNTRLCWSWKMDLLPSTAREDTLPTHDYMSIAVEFDNGQDITYYWSAALPVGTAYRCPIPTWKARETHVVIRSGSEGLGEWFDEERDIYRDYVATIGGSMPANIVQVWLIAVSFFQRTEGKCQYSDIAFVNDEQAMRVY